MNTSVDVVEQKGASRWSLSALARTLVLKQLRQLRTGSLTLVEGAQRWHFGEPQSAAALTGELHIRDPHAYVDILSGGSIGAAEAYMTGDWTTPDLTALVRIMVRNMDVLDDIEGGLALLAKPLRRWFHRLNQNTPRGSKRNIAAHYDLGNDLFELFLDPSMMYSSAIFPHAKATLAEASAHKLDVICQTLGLKPGERVIEIGTGWGGFALHAAQHYGVHVTTTTISEEQYALAQQRVAEAGLQDRITLLKQDYRALEGQFDKLVSIEMIEAVGWQYYPTFFETCSRLLKPGGAMLMQAITIPEQRYERAKKDVDFIQRYIFPGSCIPSVKALNDACQQVSDMRLVQMQDFAEHYARTLRAWFDAFVGQRERVSALGYDTTFQRMWEFYLCYCEGGFAERAIGVAHLLYAKPEFKDEPLARNLVEQGSHE
ncbi:MAG: cyclopropane-fatty-acyl-phospholipid synthase family protein [Oleiphilaceae bacterium]|nr:cyclopropane-fatty-acyl-phospholipid synthase family protein [Oleiphilaceae bacterium]